MRPFLAIRDWQRRQCGSDIALMMVLLVSVWLTGLQFSDCFLVSHTAPGPALFGQTDWTQYDASIPQIGDGPDESQSSRAVAAGWNSVHPRSYLGSTSRARGSYGEKVSAHSNSTGAPPAIEVEALTAFRAAITSDPDDALSSWTAAAAAANGSDICSGWVGVTCSAELPTHVVALNLSNFELEGSLDSLLPILGHLPFLESLDLSVNVFSGFIQGEALTNFSRLSYFSVSNNLVAGEIPLEMGELVSLQEVDLSGNNITGLIPDSLGNCSFLTSIDVGENFLTGEIPASLGALLYLEHLNVSFNSLSGSIPGALGNCSSLRSVDLHNNLNLEGGLPEEFSRLKHLQALHIRSCALTEAFPSWIANLSSLSVLDMFGNDIVGEIPETIGQLQYLGYFQVGDNHMTGVLPPSISNSTSLYLVSVTNSNISGHIPPQIGTLPKLTWLDLSGNQLTGVIPSSLANCTTLSALQLGNNELMDPEPIPAWMDSLTNLKRLYLSLMNLHGDLSEFSVGRLSDLEILVVAGNNLTGSIPAALGNCTKLVTLEVAENQLTGEIPSELGGLPYISWFNSAINQITGSFPTFIGNWSDLSTCFISFNLLSGIIDVKNMDHLSQLTEFDVYGNDFEGPIPEAISNWTSIQKLSMGENRLSGRIPFSFGNLTNLQLLSLPSNSLQGPIPVNLLTSCLRLDFIDVSLNKLEGSIPMEIGHLEKLTLVSLYGNEFTGRVPMSLGNCSNIRILELSWNHFEGNIPVAQISKMSHSLTYLDLSHNVFSGSLPVGLGECTNLNSLDISMNNLTGEIPQDLGSLKQLQFFNASFNNFIGPLPQSGIFNSSLVNESSFLGNPGLCGPVAKLGLHHQECSMSPLNVSTNQGPHCTGISCERVWMPVVAISILVFLASVLILVGIKTGWIFRRLDQTKSDHFQKVLLNFDTHVRYRERDVLQAIGDERGDNVIGVGSRSVVYKGVLPGGQMFALKMLKSFDNKAHIIDSMVLETDVMDHAELVKEAQILAKLRHKNILRCLSFYSNLDHKALIVEYMSGGSLHKHLHEAEQCKLPWATRLKLALGVAEGMKYLHHDLPEPLIHRDLKPSNILLDAEFEPKIGDFGISKFVTGGIAYGEATASRFCGTMGYMPPEYGSQAWVSTQGDVFSYGVVIIELLTRRQPCSINSTEDAHMRNWVVNNYLDEKPYELLDQALVEQCSMDKIAKDQMLYLLRVGLVCTRTDPQCRPSMINVVEMLKHIINLGGEPVTQKTVEELATTLDPPCEWS